MDKIIKIPKKEWEVFTITYKTKVSCPRCGETFYVSVSEYGPNYKDLFKESSYSNVVTDYCNRCGEQVIVELKDSREYSSPIVVNTWYSIKPNYIADFKHPCPNAEAVIITCAEDKEGNSLKKYIITAKLKDGWLQELDTVFDTWGEADKTVKYLFYIKGVSADQNISLRAHIIEEENTL